MRLRNNPNSMDKLLKHPDIVHFKPQQYKGHWQEFFKNDHPIHVELGMGRGRFITTHADQNPNINFIGIELRHVIVANALDKVLDKELHNIVLGAFNIETVEEVFAENEVDRFYINFCDPWPKSKHAKRRLTHRAFLEKYKTILKPHGEIFMKTDGQALFDFSIEEFQASGYELYDITYDLNSLNEADNVQTEYEAKFSSLGMKICRLKARL